MEKILSELKPKEKGKAMSEIVSVVKMEIGQTGKIVEIHGGAGMSLKLENLGIRVGKEIKKLNQQAMRGPVVMAVGKSQVAIGFGMATRVLVEVGKEEENNENSSNG
ncbi:MAG: FeoA family protein [bacterium]|nr:FeoA family protein [bacterium]